MVIFNYIYNQTHLTYSNRHKTQQAVVESSKKDLKKYELPMIFKDNSYFLFYDLRSISYVFYSSILYGFLFISKYKTP